MLYVISLGFQVRPGRLGCAGYVTNLNTVFRFAWFLPELDAASIIVRGDISLGKNRETHRPAKTIFDGVN